MTQKNDIPVLLAAGAITLALVGAGGWWITKQFAGDSSVGRSPNAAVTNSGPSPSPAIVPSSRPSVSTIASVAGVPSGTFNYGGSTTWAPIRRDIDRLVSQIHPGFQLVYTDPASGVPGSEMGIRMLVDGQLAFSQSSRSLRADEIAAAQQQGLTLAEISVAIEGIAIAVHPDLPIEGVTVEQLRDIYSGALTNWSQLGGPNLAITPYTRLPEVGGTVEFFISTVLGGAEFGNTIQYQPTTTEALRAVSADPGGIYYASAPEVVDQCTTKPLAVGIQPNQLVPLHQPPLIPAAQCPGQRNQINTNVLMDGSYPITRPLLVIVKKNGQVEQQAGLAYADMLLSQQGQQLLQAIGFVGIQ